MTSTFKQKLIIAEHMDKSRNLVESVCKDLDQEQKTVVENIYREFVPLIEASLTADQINQLFKGVEQNATAAGGNRTVIGQGKDVIAKANEIINNVGKWLQDTKPVQAFDQKFEQLKKQINTKFPDSKILDAVSQMGVWAKANPGKTAAIIGVLTALAALATGPVGGAIAGQVLKGATELLKGAKLSTAVGKGLKAAGLGALAGLSMDAIGDMISNVYQQFNPIPLDASRMYYETNIGNGLPSTYQDATFYGSQEQLNQFNSMWKDAVAKWQSGDYTGAEAAFNQARDFAQQAGDETLNQIALNGDPEEKLQQLTQALDALSAAAQGAGTGAAAGDTQSQPAAESLSEQNIRKIFYTVERKSMVLEEGIGDALKGMAGKAAGKLQQVGQNLTTKITADKLMKAWKAAGSPTDSDQVADVLRKAGVSDEILSSTYTSMNIPAPAAGTAAPQADANNDGKDDNTGQQVTPVPTTTASATPKEIIASLAKLDKKGKQRLMAYLQKQLGTA